MTNTAFIKLDPIDTLPEQTSLVDGYLLFTPVGSTQMYRMSLDTFTLLSQSVKILKLTDTAPTVDGLYRPESVGTYSNTGGLVAKNGYDTIFLRKGGVWSKSEFPYPQATKSIPQFADLQFPVTNPSGGDKVQCVDNFVPYQLLDGKTSTSADTPSTSPTIWKSMGVVNQTITNITQEFNVDPSQIVPSEALYNDAGASLAVDIVKRIGKNSGVDVNYREVTEYYDGTAMDDSKVDNNIYKKFNNKYYKISVAGFVNIKTIGAKGDGVTDDTNVIQLAFRVFENIYFPKGNYLCNFDLPRKINIKGDGSLYSRLIPKDQNKAVMTYKNSAPYWTFNTKIDGVGFWNANSDGSPKKTGVGFTFGYTNLDTPTQGTQFYTNVVFENCYFFGFEKAVLTPTGNIGVDFINCGGAGNKYAFYFIDARHYNEIMHAGCKTLYGGEFSGNDILFYIANKTDGFGQVIVRNTIIEGNKIVCYSENTVDSYTPIIFDGCWDEANGSHQFPNQQLTIDKWTGNIRTTQVIDVNTFIFRGVGQYIMKNGRYCEFNIDEKVSVVVKDSSVEEDGGDGGAVSTTNGGVIEYINCYSSSYFPKGAGMIVQNPIIKAKRSKTSFLTTPRFNKQTDVPNSVSKKFDVPFDLVGTFSVQGQVVNDGLIFSDSTKWTIPFTDNGQILILQINASIKINKYFLLTLDLKFSDLPSFWIGNGSGFYIVQMEQSTKRQLENKWFTLAVVGYSTEDVNGLDLWMNGKSTSVDLYANSFQCVNFDTIEALKGYLNANTFAI